MSFALTSAIVLGGAAPASTLRVANVPTRLQYPLLGYEGAISSPWLAEPVTDAVEAADRIVQELTGGDVRILIWDALRTRACQKDIWLRYEAALRNASPELQEEELQQRVGQFVSHPSGVFRHGTGGAVDVTLVNRGGPDAWLGTSFDEFTDRAAADYFRQHPPRTPRDLEAHCNRELLRGAMEQAGFVVLPAEWWHFELGTAMWAEIREKRPFLTTVLEPPADAPYPALAAGVDREMPVMVAGVALPFGTSGQRDAALAGAAPGHYYARTSTPARTSLERELATHFGG
jgi:zinc D-Ala-D-Ala dipeptidase